MRSLVLGFLIVFGFAANANTNGGGVFAKEYVYFTGSDGETVSFLLGSYVDGEWRTESLEMSQKEILGVAMLFEDIEISRRLRHWAPIE